MAKLFENVKIGIDESLEEKIQYLMPQAGPYRILKKSVDARQRHSPHFIYSLLIGEKNEELQVEKFHLEKVSDFNSSFEKPIIVGSGPAGLFAAIRLVERGIPCRLFERGSESSERIKGINQYWRYGQLDPRNNVCYGEGGAGLYSDGKLITRIKSPHIPYVLNRLVQFGAPEEIQWLANPHVGSDKIRRVIPKIRDFLRQNGCELHFNSQVSELLTEKSSNGSAKICGIKTEQGHIYRSQHVVLATGHSAEDMLFHLKDIGVFLEGKSFAMGVRVEHPQKAINKIQYRQFAEHAKLGSANYKLTYHDYQNNMGVYSFCMCPGGYVLSSGTEKDSIVCNGMSNYNRNSPYANAAIVVTVNHDKLFDKKDIFAGIEMRKQLEQKAYRSVIAKGGSKELPAQNLVSFLDNKKPMDLFKGSSPSGAMAINMNDVLPQWMSDKIREGFINFEKSMKGFITSEAQIYGVESRTSCPVRVTRHEESLESVSHQGLYPTGEGAGYAGGITSAACDGIRVAEKIYDYVSSHMMKTIL